MSGVAGALNDNLFDGKDAQGVWGWVDDYCKAHPLEMLAVATVEQINAIKAENFYPPSLTQDDD